MISSGIKKYFTFIFSFFVLILVIASIVFTSYFLYQRTSTILTENLRQRLLSISITEASNIDGDDLNNLRFKDDWQKPEWKNVVHSLHAAKYSNDQIVFMYVFRYTLDPTDDPQAMEFVADADSIDPFANSGTDTSKYVDVNRDGKVELNGPDKLQWPGQPFPEAIDLLETKEAYSGPIAAKDIYTNDYGPVITGYAPIKNASGTVVAILGTDIKADDFFTITQQTLGPFLYFISFLSFVITILILLIIFTWRRNQKVLVLANAKIEMQKNTLNDLLKIKDETLHIVNHQLNTPISVINGAVEMFKDKFWDENKFLGVVGTELKRITDTISQFLAAKKAEDGNIVLSKSLTDFPTLVKSLIDEKMLLKKVRETGIKINFTEDSNIKAVNCDAARITEVISNLLDNAINYSMKDIDVSVKNYDGGILLAVKDGGIGIPKDKVNNLFQRFSRLENAKKTRPDGSGLGLYVCKQIVGAHGGKIWVESVGEGSGSTFFISLPF